MEDNYIKSVDPTSPLHGRVEIGDTVVSINGNEILDVLDYKFFAYDRDLEVVLQKPDGTRYTLHVKKGEGGDLGLDFESYLMDAPRSCANACVFCFIDQLPRGMRKTMYFKDDDARLSFLLGNYITLTNLSDREVERIIALHVSPINVSVHTMNPELRCKMLRNPRAGETIDIMRRFAKAGIVMNCQIVCCPGLNDGDELLHSMRELEALWPSGPRCTACPSSRWDSQSIGNISIPSPPSQRSTRGKPSTWWRNFRRPAAADTAAAFSSAGTSCTLRRSVSCRRTSFTRNTLSLKTA